jgi:hypothetical protein
MFDDKTRIFLYVLVGFIVSICIYSVLNSDKVQLTCVLSTVDGNEYCVRKRSQVKEASDLLAKIATKCTKIVNHLHEKFPKDDRCKRLYANFNPTRIIETLPTSKLKAYSENKGAKIAFCLNKLEHDNNVLIDENTLMFVALHELSHLMTISVGHNNDFWANFKFILDHAIALKLYSPVNYKETPQEYCGMTITDNPYYDLK